MSITRTPDQTMWNKYGKSLTGKMLRKDSSMPVQKNKRNNRNDW